MHCLSAHRWIHIFQCESRVENKGNESNGNVAKKMKEQAREGPHNRGRLNSSQAIQPVKKTLDWLANRTDKGGKSIARSQNVLLALLSRGNKLNYVVISESRFPSNVDVGFVSIQTALLYGNMILQDLLRGRQIVLGRAGSHEGKRKGQTSWLSRNNSMEFDSIIPFFLEELKLFSHNSLATFP